MITCGVKRLPHVFGGIFIFAGNWTNVPGWNGIHSFSVLCIPGIHSMSSTSWCPPKTISHNIVFAPRYTRDYWSVFSNPPSLGVLIGFFCNIEEMRWLNRLISDLKFNLEFSSRYCTIGLTNQWVFITTNLLKILCVTRLTPATSNRRLLSEWLRLPNKSETGFVSAFNKSTSERIRSFFASNKAFNCFWRSSSSLYDAIFSFMRLTNQKATPLTLYETSMWSFAGFAYSF